MAQRARRRARHGHLTSAKNRRESLRSGLVVCRTTLVYQGLSGVYQGLSGFIRGLPGFIRTPSLKLAPRLAARKCFRDFSRLADTAGASRYSSAVRWQLHRSALCDARATRGASNSPQYTPAHASQHLMSEQARDVA
eukprot:2509379-Pyramimonas_sp.AAC.1